MDLKVMDALNRDQKSEGRLSYKAPFASDETVNELRINS